MTGRTSSGRPGPRGGDGPARPRPAPPRRRGPRKVTVGLAAVLAIAALVVGLVVGILAAGDGPAAETRTLEREVRIVTAEPGR